MSEVFARRAVADDRVGAVALSAAVGLRFAAAPTFALMALLTGVGGGAPLVCSSAPDAWALSGMTLMYALMSVIHASPWLRAISSRPPEPEPDKQSRLSQTA